MPAQQKVGDKLELQLADSGGYQIKELQDYSIDVDLNGTRDFEMSMDAADYDDRIKPGCRIFVPGTEIGGIIGRPGTDSGANKITFSGYTWRGRLTKKIIEPPAGKDYFVAQGEVHTVLKELIEPRFSGLFHVSEKNSGIQVNYQFKRFCNLHDGIVEMLKSVGMRMDIKYNQGAPNGAGWVDIEAVPIVDYSDTEELSQDSQLNFVMEEVYDGVNHLIVAGKGELQERNVIHLYVQKDGTIGKNQYYKGIDEITDVYENTSTDSAELEKDGIEKLKELMNSKSFNMDVESLGIDIAIGDIIGGRDHITGMHMAKPLENIIVTINNGTITKEYKLEG